MFSAASALIRLLIVIIVLGGAGYAFYYISNLQANLAISELNSKQLEKAIEDQKAAVENMRAEIEKINKINTQLNETIKAQEADKQALTDRFNKTIDGMKRDFGKVAAEKPKSLERAVNRGTVNALRCLEIASGAPLTEAEKNATKPSEINRECPSLANPNYKPAIGQ